MESQPILDSMEFLNTRPLNELLTEVVVKVCYVSDTPNNNDTVINKEVGRDIASALPGAPVVGYFKPDAGDFQEHSEITRWTGRDLVSEPLTQPYGFVSLDSPWYQDFIEDGIRRTYIMCKAYLWTKQFKEAALIPGKGQSIELDENDMGGYFEGDKFIFTHASAWKLCVLGDRFAPCFSGAKFATTYTSKEDNEIVTELENILGRRYCVVEGKLTEKLQTEEAQVVTPVVDTDEKNKPALTYSDSGNNSGEGSSEGSETSNGESDTEESVNTGEGAGSIVTSESGNAGEAAEAISKNNDTITTEIPGEGVIQKDGEGDSNAPEGLGILENVVPAVDPVEPEPEDSNITVKGKRIVDESGAANAATVVAEAEIKATESTIESNIGDLKPETNYSEGGEAGGETTSVSESTPATTVGEINGAVIGDEVQQMIASIVSKMIAEQGQASAQGEAATQIDEAAAQINATQENIVSEANLDIDIASENGVLKSRVDELETENKRLQELVDGYTKKEAEEEVVKKEALIQDYLKLLSEEEIGALKTKYATMSYEDTENLLSVTYSRKQRRAAAEANGNSGIQISIGSLVSANESFADLPGFMRKAMEFEGQLS